MRCQVGRRTRQKPSQTPCGRQPEMLDKFTAPYSTCRKPCTDLSRESYSTALYITPYC